jgi:hypothetical protein
MAAPQAAIKLLDCMARFHRDENSRLEAFCDWHDKWVGFRFSDARRGSISSGSADKPCLDGEFYVVGSSYNYLVVLLEVKDELGSSGDPHYQLQRYMQVSSGCCCRRCCALIRLLHALCCTTVAFTAGCCHDLIA